MRSGSPHVLQEALHRGRLTGRRLEERDVTFGAEREATVVKPQRRAAYG